MQHRGMEAVCCRLAVLMQNVLHLLIAGQGSGHRKELKRAGVGQFQNAIWRGRAC